MSDDSTTQCLLFPGIFRKLVVAQFDQREGSSDGGALLLKAADGHYRLVEELTACLQDQRQAGKVDHTLRDLVARACSPLPVATPTATTRPDWAATPFISCFSVAIPRARPGLATDGVAFRECGRSQGTVSHGRDFGPECHPAAWQATTAPGVPGHHRSGSHR